MTSTRAGAPRVVVVGAGAAGAMAAIFAATAGADTRLLERTRDGGRKILISGGGRCNILPARVDERRFVTDSSPNTLRKILRSWPHRDQIAFFETELGIPLVEETASGKLFPVSNRAREVRDGLIATARSRGARFEPGTTVTGIRPAASADGQPRAGHWVIERAAGESIRCDAVIVATGGLSVPNTGSDGMGLDILARLGHTIHPTYPALTPITAKAPEFTALAGVSLTVSIQADDGTRRAEATGGFLFTHRGYSGPSVLDVSHVLVRARMEGHAARLVANWTGRSEADWEGILQPAGSETVAGTIRRLLPDRLADVLIGLAAVDGATALAQLRRTDRLRLIELLCRCPLPWDGDEGYRKAEVTGGGVALDEVHPTTLESRRHPGLYICGEALDAFGPIGGYNFLWAWATGRAAGLGAAAGRADPDTGSEDQ